MNDVTTKKDAFRIAIRLIDSQRKSLVESDARGDIIVALESIIKFLHRMPDYQVARLMGEDKARPAAIRRDVAINSAKALSLADVEKILSNEGTSRTDLEAIAIGRFHVPRGSMRSLGNIEILRQKIATFIENEKTHATITELASKSR